MTRILAALSAASFLACASAPAKKPAAPPSPAMPDTTLLSRWTGPYGGVPPFDRVRVQDLAPALDAAMASCRRDVQAIAADPVPPTFENTLAALERAGRGLENVQTIFGVWASTMSSPEFQAVEREVAPKLAAFSDEITQNERLFRRIEAVYEARERSGLTPEQQRLVWLQYTTFVREGAKLDAAGKARVAAVNQRLATLYTQFGQNVLKDEEEYAVILPSEADLAGLPASLRAAASAAAEERAQQGKWAIGNTRSFVEPFLTYSTRRDLREQVWRNFVSRGDHRDARDTNAIIAEILKLRAERARLLGYPTHAHWRLEHSMAKTPERAMALLEAVWTPAVARVREEVAEMQAVADREKAGFRIAPWDYRFYAEKVRKAKYDLDDEAVKPYLELEHLREGMFWVAGELLGLSFAPVSGVPVYHPDVRVWEVTDRKSGKHVGLWYFDPYARKGKRSGAWMNAYRRQERMDGEVTTIVSNNANFVKGAPGEPVLVSWTDAETLFHEFGHALHGLASDVTYPSLSGTQVARDYVEMPSQLLEHWLPTPEVLTRFARHYRTGEPIPPALVERIEKASTFNQGFKTVEYLASALVDLKLHTAPDASKIDPVAFEKDTLAAIGMPAEIVMRHRTPQFQHVFAGDGYSAGYYSYLWADTLTADVYEAFTEGKGPYDAEVAARLRKDLLAPGNTVDPGEAYRAFRGRDAKIDALMRMRGFPVPATGTAGSAPAAPAKSGR
ncbi:M3 family metallopeptidase [Anaeromyxobacter oryzae]|uniref:Peptidase M3 n=1 Tax=Anaeromyxobacter oryzae TaxID=2918170 RepID=A0ABM7X4D0_9BACT|nr:M3 family metallopeptidase [Anaeromyxobacter oryzae]BDG06656.1 peptidase M3 [Anaeromyxobacter oryzae]